MFSSYPIHCSHRGCERLAVYKIAARWSDGVTGELKTYALVCEDCLPDVFRMSCHKNASCRRAKGESLEKPSIYLLSSGQRDRQLQRCTDLEERLAGEPVGERDQS